MKLSTGLSIFRWFNLADLVAPRRFNDQALLGSPDRGSVGPTRPPTDLGGLLSSIRLERETNRDRNHNQCESGDPARERGLPSEGVDPGHFHRPRVLRTGTE